MRAVAVVGSLTSDVVGAEPPRVGGAPYYAAAALRILARPSLVVTRCADADRPALLPPLIAQGPPVEWHAAATTFRFRLAYTGRDRTMHLDAVGDPWLPGPWLDGLRRVDAVHVGALARDEFPEETVAAIARGRRVSLDGQGLVRVAEPGPLRLEPDPRLDLLRHVSMLKLGEEEAVALVGTTEPAALAALGVQEVVVTRGDRGSVVVADGAAEEVPALPVPGADPTGAGDAFAAAYLVSRSAGLRPAAAARRATAVVAELLVRRRR